MSERERVGKPTLHLGAIAPSTIHLCVDMQRMFWRDTIWSSPWLDQVIAPISAICERHAERTIFTRFIPPAVPEEATGMWRSYFSFWRQITGEYLEPVMWDLVPALTRFCPPARIADKPGYSPFRVPAFRQWLVQQKVTGLVVSGAETDVCILSTVLAAIEYSLRVTLVTDAICSCSDDSHDILLAVYRKRFAQQVDFVETEELLSEWNAA